MGDVPVFIDPGLVPTRESGHKRVPGDPRGGLRHPRRAVIPEADTDRSSRPPPTPGLGMVTRK